MGGGFAGHGLARGCLYQTVTPVHLGSFSCAYDVIEMGTLVNVRRSMLSEGWGGQQQPFCGFDFFYGHDGGSCVQLRRAQVR